jgi:hypothetical protein
VPTHSALQRTYEQFRERVDALKRGLRVVNDDVVPLAGTDDGRGNHQYLRLAIVATKDARPRHFALFVESAWFVDQCHKALGHPDWMRDPVWDNNWNYIEEITRKPGVGDRLYDYVRAIPDEEDELWTAVKELLYEDGILLRAAKKFKAQAVVPGTPAR